jgi:hypothetical protein
MKIEVWNLDRIRPYPNNPRINDDAVDAVAASIREFGVRQAIVVDTDGVIICGHTRFKAAQKLGLEKLPVHVAKDLTPEQIKAYRIADNKTAELADWNYDLLPIELGDLQTNGFDLSLLGFDSDELLKLLKTDVEEGLSFRLEDLAEEAFLHRVDRFASQEVFGKKRAGGLWLLCVGDLKELGQGVDPFDRFVVGLADLLGLVWIHLTEGVAKNLLVGFFVCGGHRPVPCGGVLRCSWLLLDLDQVLKHLLLFVELVEFCLGFLGFAKVAVGEVRPTQAAAYASVATGDVADLVSTLQGVLVTRPWQIPELEWSYVAATGGVINTTDVPVVAAAGAGLRRYICSMQLSNNSAVHPTHVVASSSDRSCMQSTNSVAWPSSDRTSM